MDDIPYDFIDKVLTLSRSQDICTIRDGVPVPTWKEAAKKHDSKRQHVQIQLFFSDSHCKCNVACLDQQLTFDDVLSMDQRFVYVTSFAVEPRDQHWSTYPVFPVDRIPAMLSYVALFPLDRLIINLGTGLLSGLRKTIFDCLAVCKNDLEPVLLDIRYCSEADSILRAQLKSTNLRQLRVLGVWPPSVTSALEDFVRQPQFEDLKCPDFQCFDCLAIMRLEAHWRYQSLYNHPLKNAHVVMKPHPYLENEFYIALGRKQTNIYQFYFFQYDIKPCLWVDFINGNCYLDLCID